jgi:xanthine dehydrogenase YagS FAD-binding subunit
MNQFSYGRASSVQEALDVIDDTCRPLAGGTDLLAMIKEGLLAPESLVDVKRIGGLDRVRQEDDTLCLGALIRLSDLIEEQAVSQEPWLACLYHALLQTASPQLRHMATLGGNLLQRPRCWYFRNKNTHCLRKGGQRCFAFRGENKYHAILGGGPCYIVHPSDPAVALLALDASVVLAGPDGTRTVPLDAFYLLPKTDPHREVDLSPQELLTEILLPIPASGTRGTYIKIAERQAWDFALVSVAVQLVVTEGVVQQARVALGGVAPVPWRAEASEEVLNGAALTDDVIEQAAVAATEGARALAQNAFKIEMVQGLVRQGLNALKS